MVLGTATEVPGVEELGAGRARRVGGGLWRALFEGGFGVPGAALPESFDLRLW